MKADSQLNRDKVRIEAIAVERVEEVEDVGR
jgi:ribosomal protein L20A (L18A)